MLSGGAGAHRTRGVPGVLAGTTDLGHQTPQEMIDAPPDWVSELISRLDEDLISTANAGAKTSGEPAGQRGEDAADPEGVPFFGAGAARRRPRWRGHPERRRCRRGRGRNGRRRGPRGPSSAGWRRYWHRSSANRPRKAWSPICRHREATFPTRPPTCRRTWFFIEYIPEVPVDETEAGIAEGPGGRRGRSRAMRLRRVCARAHRRCP